MIIFYIIIIIKISLPIEETKNFTHISINKADIRKFTVIDLCLFIYSLNAFIIIHNKENIIWKITLIIKNILLLFGSIDFISDIVNKNSENNISKINTMDFNSLFLKKFKMMTS